MALKIDQIKDLQDNSIISKSGSNITLGASNDTITVPTGASLTVPNGGLTGQNYPAFHAYSASAQSIPNTTQTTMTFTTEDFDTDNAFDTSTGIFTVPSNKGGKYFLYCSAALNGVTPSRFLLTGYHNNATAIMANETGNASAYSIVNVGGQFNLSAGDTFRFKIYQNNGGAVNTFAYRHIVFIGAYRIGA